MSRALSEARNAAAAREQDAAVLREEVLRLQNGARAAAEAAAAPPPQQPGLPATLYMFLRRCTFTLHPMNTHFQTILYTQH